MESNNVNINTIISIITNHPFFTEPDGEITKNYLVKWIKSQLPKFGINDINSIEIEKNLLKCEEMELINIKHYEKGWIITPTKKLSESEIKPKEPLKSEKKSIFSIIESGNFEDVYAQMLLEKVRKYPENFEDTVFLPFFFKLASNLINEKYTDWHTKLMLCAGMGYILLQEDIIPDYHPDGYIDDLFALSHCLRETKLHNSPHVLRNCWEYKEDIFSLIETVYDKSRLKLGSKTNLVLHKIGLKKFKSLEIINYDPGVFQTINLMRTEKRDLIKLIINILDITYSSCSKSDIDKIMLLVQNSSDYDEIKMEVFSKNDKTISPKPTRQTIIEYLNSHQK